MGDERKASDLDVITSDLTKLSLQNDLSILPEEEFVIEIQGQTLKCCRELLKRNSKFFEGFFNFEPNKKRIHIEGGLDFDSCEKLVQFWQTAQLDVSGSTVQELLLGATYLQSSCAESECVAYMTGQLSRENAFRTYKFAAGVAASAGLQNAAQLFIETTFHPVLNLFVDMGGSTLKEFLAATKGRWESVLSADVPVCEELLFYALLGWIEHDLEKRTHEAADLFHLINFCLMPKSSLEQILLDELDLFVWCPDLKCILQQSVDYHSLTQEQQEAYWDQRQGK